MPKHCTLYEWCVKNGREDLLNEWDTEKNAALGITSQKIGYTSSKTKTWWLKEQYSEYSTGDKSIESVITAIEFVINRCCNIKPEDNLMISIQR